MQDDVWMTKCIRYGWFLPYTPADNEYGAWKRHYVACIHTLDSMEGSRQVNKSNTDKRLAFSSGDKICIQIIYLVSQL